jgi:hypothetical protein
VPPENRRAGRGCGSGADGRSSMRDVTVKSSSGTLGGRRTRARRGTGSNDWIRMPRHTRTGPVPRVPTAAGRVRVSMGAGCWSWPGNGAARGPQPLVCSAYEQHAQQARMTAAAATGSEGHAHPSVRCGERSVTSTRYSFVREPRPSNRRIFGSRASHQEPAPTRVIDCDAITPKGCLKLRWVTRGMYSQLNGNCE